jgi:hypothetical protein
MEGMMLSTAFLLYGGFTSLGCVNERLSFLAQTGEIENGVQVIRRKFPIGVDYIIVVADSIRAAPGSAVMGIQTLGPLTVVSEYDRIIEEFCNKYQVVLLRGYGWYLCNGSCD